MNRWRTGRKLGRTLYLDEVCVGMVDTPELARAIVEAMNGKEQPSLDQLRYEILNYEFDEDR